MKLTPQERERNRSAFVQMHTNEKVDYIFTYFKLPLTLLLIAVIVLGSILHKALTKKEPYIYLSLVNVKIGSELEQTLTTEFLHSTPNAQKNSSIELYQGLYLTDDPASEFYQYVYASRLKVLASIEAKQLDLVLMNQEAYDTLSQSGYLADLSVIVGDNTTLAPYLTQNIVIYEDNAEAHFLDETIPYEAVTGEETNALVCSELPLFDSAGFEQAVYIGVIANSDRTEQSVDYLQWLIG